MRRRRPSRQGTSHTRTRTITDATRTYGRVTDFRTDIFTHTLTHNRRHAHPRSVRIADASTGDTSRRIEGRARSRDCTDYRLSIAAQETGTHRV